MPTPRKSAKKKTAKKSAARKPAAKKSATKRSTARKPSGKKSAARKATTARKPAARKAVARKVPVRSSAARSTASSSTPLPGEDLLVGGAGEGLDVLAETLGRAQQAQRALVEAHRQLREQRAAANDEADRLRVELGAERDDALAQAEALQAAVTVTERQLGATVKACRSLFKSLAASPDPLAPLTKDDDDRDYQGLRGQLRDVDDGVDVLPEQLAAARDFVECLRARSKTQGNRVKLLRQHVAELGDGQEALEAELAAQRATAEAAAKDLARTTKELDAQRGVAEKTTEKLEKAEARLAAEKEARQETTAELKETRAAAKAEAARQAAQAKEHEVALGEARELARSAEQAAVGIAEVLVELAAADAGTEALRGAPSVTVPREELESLVNDAGDEFDDEIDDLFREDYGEDLVRSAKGLVEALQHRRAAVVAELLELRGEVAELGEAQAGSEAENRRLTAELARISTALERAEVQLAATQEEAERLTDEAAARAKELKELQREHDRATRERDAALEKAALVPELREELRGQKSELGSSRKTLDRSAAQARRVTESVVRIARGMVDLATACDGASASAGLKSGAHIARLTKPFAKLDAARLDSAEEVQRVAKLVGEVVDKVRHRLAQLRQHCGKVDEERSTLSADQMQLGERVAGLEAALAEKDQAIAALKAERGELAKEAKRAAKLDAQLAKREERVEALQTQVAVGKQALLEAKAAIEELRAREEAAVSGLGGEVDELKRRLGDAERARRSTESEAGEQRAELQAALSTAEARATELERSLEDREQTLASLQVGHDGLVEKAEAVKALELRLAHLGDELAGERQRSAELERRVEEAAEAAVLQKDLDAAHAEREQLRGKLREAEKRLADDAGTIAALQSHLDSMKRKFDRHQTDSGDRQQTLQERCDALLEENRRIKEQNAGLNARVRTYTQS